jgi:hypothetical protein
LAGEPVQVMGPRLVMAIRDNGPPAEAQNQNRLKVASCLSPGESQRGFKNPFRVEYAIIKVGDLEVFKGKDQVSIQDLAESGFIKNMKNGIKLLSDGDIDFSIKITVHKASQKAIDKVRAKGGDVEVLI